MDEMEDFVTGKAFKIEKAQNARWEEKSVNVVVPTGLSSDHSAEKKPIPNGIPTSGVNNHGQASTIHWITNFGLKKNGKWVNNPSEPFQVTLDLEQGKSIFYYDGNNVVPFDVSDIRYSKKQPGKVFLRMRLGDPPIGWGVP